MKRTDSPNVLHLCSPGISGIYAINKNSKCKLPCFNATIIKKHGGYLIYVTRKRIFWRISTGAMTVNSKNFRISSCKWFDHIFTTCINRTQKIMEISWGIVQITIMLLLLYNYLYCIWV